MPHELYPKESFDKALQESFDTMGLTHDGTADRFGGPKSESTGTGLSQIPHEALLEIGNIFKEGEVKYGRDNWKGGVFNAAYQDDRYEHALKHMGEVGIEMIPDEKIKLLAKVGWFAVTQIKTLIDEKKAKKQKQSNAIMGGSNPVVLGLPTATQMRILQLEKELEDLKRLKMVGEVDSKAAELGRSSRP